MEGSASVMSTISLVGPEATADAPAPVSPAATTREVLAHTIVSKKRVDSTPTPDLSPVNTEGIAAPSEPDAPRPVTTVTVQEPSPFSTLALPSATHEIFVSSPTPNAPAIAGSETVWTSEQTASADLPPDANSGLPPLLGQPVVETFYTTVTKVGQGITPTPTFPSVKQTETPELPLPNAPSLVTGSSVLQSSFPIGQSSPMPALSSIEQIETPGLPTTPNAPSLVTGNSALQSIFTPENPTRSLSFPFIDQTETLASSSTLNPANLVTGNSVFQSTFTPEEPTPVLTPDLSSTHQFETSALPSDPITPVEVTPTSVIQLAVTREPAGSIPTPSLSSIREAETLISPSYTNGPIVVTRTSLFYSTVTRQGQPTVSMPSVLSTSDAVAPTLGNHFVSTETVVRQQGGYTPVLTSSTASDTDALASVSHPTITPQVEITASPMTGVGSSSYPDITPPAETVPSVFSNNGVVASSFQSSTVVDTVVTSLRPTEPGVYASPTITPDAGTISSPPMSIEPSPLSTTTPYIEFTPSSDIGALTSPLEPTVTPNTEIASLPSSSVRVSVPPSYPTTAPPSEYGDILSPSYPTNPADVEATSTPSPPISTPAVADETALISDVVPISTTSPQPLPSGYIATQSLLLASHTTPPIAAFTSSSHHKITPAVPTNKSLSLGSVTTIVTSGSSSNPASQISLERPAQDLTPLLHSSTTRLPGLNTSRPPQPILPSVLTNTAAPPDSGVRKINSTSPSRPRPTGGSSSISHLTDLPVQTTSSVSPLSLPVSSSRLTSSSVSSASALRGLNLVPIPEPSSIPPVNSSTSLSYKSVTVFTPGITPSSLPWILPSTSTLATASAVSGKTYVPSAFPKIAPLHTGEFPTQLHTMQIAHDESPTLSSRPKAPLYTGVTPSQLHTMDNAHSANLHLSSRPKASLQTGFASSQPRVVTTLHREVSASLSRGKMPLNTGFSSSQSRSAMTLHVLTPTSASYLRQPLSATMISSDATPSFHAASPSRSNSTVSTTTPYHSMTVFSTGSLPKSQLPLPASSSHVPPPIYQNSSSFASSTAGSLPTGNSTSPIRAGSTKSPLSASYATNVLPVDKSTLSSSPHHSASSNLHTGNSTSNLHFPTITPTGNSTSLHSPESLFVGNETSSYSPTPTNSSGTHAPDYAFTGPRRPLNHVPLPPNSTGPGNLFPFLHTNSTAGKNGTVESQVVPPTSSFATASLESPNASSSSSSSSSYRTLFPAASASGTISGTSASGVLLGSTASAAAFAGDTPSTHPPFTTPIAIPATSTAAAAASSGPSLGPKQITGIGLGCAASIALAVAGVILFVMRKHKKRPEDENQPPPVNHEGPLPTEFNVPRGYERSRTSAEGREHAAVEVRDSMMVMAEAMQMQGVRTPITPFPDGTSKGKGKQMEEVPDVSPHHPEMPGPPEEPIPHPDPFGLKSDGSNYTSGYLSPTSRPVTTVDPLNITKAAAAPPSPASAAALAMLQPKKGLRKYDFSSKYDSKGYPSSVRFHDEPGSYMAENTNTASMYLQRSGSRRSQRGTTLTGYGGLRESNIGATIIEDDERSWRESGEGTTYGLGLSDAARGVPRVKKSYGSEGVDDDGKERGDGGYSSFGYPAFDRSAYTNYEEFLEAEKARGHRRVES